MNPEAADTPLKTKEAERSNALERITVLDLTSYLAGPYGCALLGDVGANVIKVEAPGGDAIRHYPSTLPAGESRFFLGANRNKRSIVIDLKTKEGRALLYRMMEQVDVLMHNFRPSVPVSLGVDYETLKTIRSDLIYCSLTGYGEHGPLRDHPGFDQMLQCFSGIAHAQGEQIGSPQILRGSVVDIYTSALLAFAVTAAIVHRLRTGEGQHVRLSLLQSALALQPSRFIWADCEPRDIEREPAAGRVTAAHPTKEGFLYVQASTPPFWMALCELIGRPELGNDPRYDTLKKRYDLADEVMPVLREAFMARTALEWEALMTGRVPCIAVRTIGDMFDHPQVLAEKLVVRHEHPDFGGYRALGRAVDMGCGNAESRPAPMLGEHTNAILDGFGCTRAEIANLRAAGAVS